MKQHEIAPAAGATHSRKRVGRGDGSGHGSYSGKGMKGQKSRSSPDIRPGFEGGQLPLIKRMPHTRGFTNIFRTEYSVVNVEQLERFEAGEQVTPQVLYAAGLVRTLRQPVKVLGSGSLSKSLSVSAHSFTESAREKIEAAGGEAQEL